MAARYTRMVACERVLYACAQKYQSVSSEAGHGIV